ncbi:hypothetical protein BD309DRAFT_861438 [Dichomitus squalens]|uniref:Meiotically up-regulated protein Msb1/Mug8 domain-containing protein n=1 Tax=Dichomitus squalens TaxID=114155 RepID=A0A4Q9NYT7_9APHY|nr:hypothetical protein BD309DRAFT_861438 [Dichomitus squalens]TBU56092.1 hypothetical protein BD310DRAFT_639801 [Dichomitus squalens]
MPSLFSRARTTSTPTKKASSNLGALDEFGRVDSRGSVRQAVQQHLAVSTKSRQRKDSKAPTRARPPGAEDEDVDFGPPDGSFLPLRLDRPLYENPNDPAQELPPAHDYGYLSYQRHVILGLEEVARLVDVVGDELGTRGLTTPFIFSSLALDASPSAAKRLIQAFLKTCSRPSPDADRQWRQEARLAEPHELGMTLRWGLARAVRWVNGHEVRGLVSYDAYLQWRDTEAALNYPGLHFSAFLDPLDGLLRSLLVGLFTLLSRFTAHSATSGHTPPTLSPLFGPLLFGLGPSTLNFHHAYMHYLRATTATEHLILAFIRWQDAKANAASPAIGTPTRLKAWIQGYPSMLPTLGKNERPQPRRGARTARVLNVRRNVRMYSPDLVKTCASWANRPRAAASSAGERAFAGSKEWERIAPPTLKLPPRYSDGYKKRMVLAPNFHPDTGIPGSTSSTLTPPSLSSSISSASSAGSTLFEDKEGEERFRSLTDLKWGEFEAMGFGNIVADEKKLQFDLTEGARAARAAKRATLNWQDFSSSGFSRTDAHLSATLQFSAPVANQITSWPAHQAEMHRKLKKTQKALPAFGWDTEPIMGGEEVIEEAFVDVFCDLIYGGGWMDDERHEETDRECNWALVEFKSLPVSRTNTASGTSDPRTATTLILFEEFVPYEYRQQLASAGQSRRKLPSFFSSGTKSKQWKPAATLNGRPYVVGAVPHSPSFREVEFEGLLRSNGSATKVISLARSPNREQGKTAPPVASTVAIPGHELSANPLVNVTNPALKTQFLTPLRTDSPMPTRAGLGTPRDESGTPTKKGSRFRLPTGLPTSPAGKRAGLLPTEYDPVDFDTRLASFDDDLPRDRHQRRKSKDDAWVDILVATNNRRMAGQDAELRNGLRGGRSDPELASQEVSEVLAAVRGHFSDEEDESMEPVAGPSDDANGDTSTIQDSLLERDMPERESVADGDEGEGHSQPVPRKRMGYFDLHPERRPPTWTSDARDELGRPSYESDTSTENPYTAATVTMRTNLAIREDSALLRQSAASEYESDPEPVVAGSQAVPRDVKTLPRAPGDGPVPPAKTSLSKTAHLIEMYRERERQTSPIPSSRLPVRQASLQAPTPNGNDRSRSTSPSPRPSPRPSPHAVVPAELPEIDDPADDKVSVEDIPIDLPTQYVHGAPLHNVIEEPEEEEA